jgi:hypothetical protein
VYELDGTLHAGWPQVEPSCDPAPPAEACWDFGGYNQNIGAGDLDGDGVLDVISSYDAIGFGVFTVMAHRSRRTELLGQGRDGGRAYHDLALSRQGWGTGDRSGSPTRLRSSRTSTVTTTKIVWPVITTLRRHDRQASRSGCSTTT